MICKHDAGDTWEKKNDCGCLMVATKRNFPVCKFCHSPEANALERAKDQVIEAAKEYTKLREYQNVDACRKDQDRLEKVLLDALAALDKLEGK